MKRTNKKGITLIALIITIIVLLIIAGVSINLVLGNNGVVSKAQHASSEYKKAEYIDIINMEISAEQIDWYVKKAGIESDEGKNKTFSESLGDRIKKKLGLSSNYEISSDNKLLTITTDDGYEIPIDIDNEKIIATIKKEDILFNGKKTSSCGGSSTRLTVGSSNTDWVDLYGNEVTGYNVDADNNGTIDTAKWYLFYVDDVNAYILRESIGSQSLPTSDSTAIDEPALSLNSMYANYKGVNYFTEKADNNNVKAVRYLTNRSNWEQYEMKVNGKSIVNYAIGGPSAELLVASCNAKENADLTLSIDEEYYDGYLVTRKSFNDSKNIYKGYWTCSPARDTVYGNTRKCVITWNNAYKSLWRKLDFGSYSN